MAPPSPPKWTIQSDEQSGELRHSIWCGTVRVAADIAVLEDARVLRSAPELLEFARRFIEVATPQRLMPGEIAHPEAVVHACREFQWDTWADRLLAPIPSLRFDELFKAAIAQIGRDADAVGLTLQRVAQEVGISRAQFARWRNRPPSTIQSVTKLQIFIEGARGGRGQTV